MEVKWGVIGLGLVGIAAGVYFLALGLQDGQPWAFVVVTAFVVIFLVALGFTLALVSRWFDEAAARRRDEVEQARFTANQRENLSMMALTARAQAAQSLALQRQLRLGAPGLPEPDAGGVIFDDALFSDRMIDGEVGQ